ncbi:MAG: hypothetical protein M1814_004906 [Vezdaea aestivalis]|nr:MAG: hypothetical protein M1814_004906 [Vezdaea aestivalis]
MEPGRVKSPPIQDTPGAFPETPAESLRKPSQSTSQSNTSDGSGYQTPLAYQEVDDPITPRAIVRPTATEDEDAITPSKEIVTRYPFYEPDQPMADLEKVETVKADPDPSTAGTDHDISKTASGRKRSEADIFLSLSKRKTNASTGTAEEEEEMAEIQQLMTRMFGKTRQANSEEEQTRHTGVVFKNLTVKGTGLGATLQPTVGDLFMGLPRTITSLFSRGKKLGGKPPVRNIINNFNGCVKPGEMLLVLGKPGSGCSTFLKVLGNQRFGYTAVDGDVTYGGTDAQTMAKDFRGEVLYNPENDLHYATLNVKRTLTFALTTRTPGKASRAEGESRAQYVSEFLRVISKLFWIEHTMGTKVGNEFIRGVSGGEKKRVSIAEGMITKASIQCWDSASTGLDSSTALEYVQSLRTLTNMAHISTAVALYQAGESLYDLFDKVILIHEGRCAYFGSADDAKKYFTSLGFHCPPRWTTADFLTSVTDKHERQISEGWEDRIPRSAEEFETAFKNSESSKKSLSDIAEFETHLDEQRRAREAHSTKATKKRNYTIPFWKQVLACTDRQFWVMVGDPLTLYGKWGGILFQALIVGSLFYNLPATASGVFPRGGVLFFILLFNALLALAELTSAFSSRPILMKHKSFSFYRPAAYAIAQTIIDVPLVLTQVTIFNIVVYFMANLGRTASQFFISLLIVFALTMNMYAFFRAIGALVESLDVATRITGVAIQALIVYTGYLIPPTKMHPWFKWLIWINPVQYGFEALMANEFAGLDIECTPPFLVPAGPGAQRGYQSCLIQGSQPGQTTVKGQDYILSAFTYRRSHLWRNFGIIVAFWLLFVLLTMLGMELQKPNKGSGSVIVFKRGKAPKRLTDAIENFQGPNDEEKAQTDSSGSSNKEEESESDGKVLQRVARNDTIFTWSNVNYTIPYQGGERQLLKDVQGYVRPGKLTALMGASGAGKTTLLTALAQRINFGRVTGEFLVDGAPLPLSFQRATGFAEQMDIHEPTATVREALQFSAYLRQPKEVSIKEKYDYVETIIDLLEMKDIAGATIGAEGRGLNVEQRKRVTIGVELASKPSLLLFLDEPTSGLDSLAAFNILRFLRKLADAGQAILATIHQPSAVLFSEFDELLLLKSGGRVVYHGELGKDGHTLIQYLEEHGSTKCPPKANPAEFMLTAIGAGDPNYHGQDWGDVWANSTQHQARTDEIKEMIKTRRAAVKDKAETKDDREFAMPMTTQIMAVVKRSFVSYWRTPEYMIGKFALHIVTGLFNVFTFFKLGNSYIDMQSRLFSVFMTLTISPPLIQQLQPKLLAFRNIYDGRESKAKIYSWVAFCCGAIIVEIPYSIIAGTIYFMCWYWGIGFPTDSFSAAYCWLMMMLFELYYVGFGQAIAAFAANELLASILVPLFFLFVISFAGVVVPYAGLPYFWRAWMFDLTPFRYIIEGWLGVILHNVEVRCAPDEFARFPPPPNMSCEAYAEGFIKTAGGYVQDGANGLCEFCQVANGDEFARSFNVLYSYHWRDFGIICAYIGFNFMVVFVASYLFLGGGKKVKAFFSPAQRRQKKLQQTQNEKSNA